MILSVEMSTTRDGFADRYRSHCIEPARRQEVLQSRGRFRP